MSRILTAVYEKDFMDFSYGFRPGRNCHQALQRLDRAIMTKPVNYIVDANISGFFDTVNHEWMIRFLEHRMNEPKFMRLLRRFLKNGYVEDGLLYTTDKGTPQGGLISPVLANIYLHYVLDLWFDRRIKPDCKGYVELVRYADDFIICAQYQEEAERIYEQLEQRVEKS
jgi:RNA-directed DNA polymerase